MGKLFVKLRNSIINMLNKPSHIIDNEPQLFFQFLTVSFQLIRTRIQRQNFMQFMSLVLVHTTGTYRFLIIIAV
jgi:hypothetical protein